LKDLIIEASKTTPAVKFNADSGILEISGESYPENASKFYEPILDWLTKFIGEKEGEIIFNFRMIYFNTSSSKAIFDIIELLENSFNDGKDVKLNWYFEEDDEDIEESGEEFTEDLNMPCKLLSY
jgi:hypothetical protein